MSLVSLMSQVGGNDSVGGMWQKYLTGSLHVMVTLKLPPTLPTVPPVMSMAVINTGGRYLVLGASAGHEQSQR